MSKTTEFFALVEICSRNPHIDRGAGSRLFSDGEHTNQKAGEFLFRRHEWQMAPPAMPNFHPELWPNSLSVGDEKFGFVWATYEDARELRELLLELVLEIQ